MANYIYTNDGLVNTDELMHKGRFKYVNKIPDGRGGYKYIYYRQEGRSGKGGSFGRTYTKINGKPDSEYGTYVNGNDQIQRYRTSKLFSQRDSVRRPESIGGGSYTIERIGLLEQSANKLSDQAKKVVAKGKKKVDKFFKKMSKKK